MAELKDLWFSFGTPALTYSDAFFLLQSTLKHSGLVPATLTVPQQITAVSLWHIHSSCTNQPDLLEQGQSPPLAKLAAVTASFVVSPTDPVPLDLPAEYEYINATLPRSLEHSVSRCVSTLTVLYDSLAEEQRYAVSFMLLPLLYSTTTDAYLAATFDMLLAYFTQ